MIFNSEISNVKSTLDNNTYMIRRVNKDPQFLLDSANKLAEININIKKLIVYLNNNYRNNPNYFFIKELDKYNHNMISEATIDPRFTTYTVDKTDMHICLRTRNSEEKLYDTNTLMYVCIHEIAHMCNYTQNGEPIIGHGSEFKMIFKFLIDNAIKIGIYKYVDYTVAPVDYCGIIINTQITMG
jgi:hypothetical protein